MASPNIPSASIAPTAGRVQGWKPDYVIDRDINNQIEGYYAQIKAENDANRAWSAAQAQKAMDFEERMSNTAHQREMADLAAAGLNPILSAGGAGASTPSGHAASGDSANVTALYGLMSKALTATIDQAEALKNSARREILPISDVQKLIDGLTAKAETKPFSRSGAGSKSVTGHDDHKPSDFVSYEEWEKAGKPELSPEESHDPWKRNPEKSSYEEIMDIPFIDAAMDWIRRKTGIKPESLTKVIKWVADTGDNISDKVLEALYSEEYWSAKAEAEDRRRERSYHTSRGNM